MPNVKTHRVGLIMNGVTGRMGSNQHLMRSIVPLLQQGGLRISPEEVILPDPILVGRNPAKLEQLADRSGIDAWTTDLEAVLEDDAYSVYFDAQTTDRRVESVMRAIAAGKHVYCEKPSAPSTNAAMALYRAAEQAGIKHGVVQDKLWLPGLLKLQGLRDSGFFGRILSVRGEFGYWVFEGDLVPPQRPSWNYRKEDGGGIVLDMFPHWRYVLDNLFGQVRAVCAVGVTHVPQRWDESGGAYEATADDAAYGIFELEGGIVAQFNSSWCVRVRRDDLFTVQVDGTKGSAVAGLRKCYMQPAGAAPRPVWNPDVDTPHSFLEDWLEVPDQREYDNAFKIQWELFLRHVVLDEPFHWDLKEAAKGVQLAEKAYESSENRTWVPIPELAL